MSEVSILKVMLCHWLFVKKDVTKNFENNQLNLVSFQIKTLPNC